MSALSIWQRVQFIKQRRRVHGNTLCDLCREVEGAERHHLVNKHSTVSSPEARAMAEEPCLSAWLCRECHTVADTHHNDGVLFSFNIHLWGEDVVRKALDDVNQYLNTPVQF